MFILNEEVKEQERQAIKELYPKFPDTQVIVTKVPLKPFYKAHRIQFIAMAHVTKILAKYGYLEVSGDKVALRYRIYYYMGKLELVKNILQDIYIL